MYVNLFLTAFALLVLVQVASGDQASYLKRTGKAYLAEVAAKPGVFTLKSGMLVEVLKESTKEGARSPNAGDSCKTTYVTELSFGKNTIVSK
jgi:FKBP-type peptidyl-prolyl cis-trans isomerase